MSNAEQDNKVPFLTEVIDFLRPQIIEERRNDMLKLAVSWVIEELRTYGHTYGTDDVSCEVGVHKCRSQLTIEGVETDVLGYQLLLGIEGAEPQHPKKEVDCFFAMNDIHQIDQLYLPGQRPDGTPGNQVQ